jgi:hypothetical protein
MKVIKREEAIAMLRGGIYPNPCPLGCPTVERFRRTTCQALLIEDMTLHGDLLPDMCDPQMLKPQFCSWGCQPEGHTELRHFGHIVEHLLDETGIHCAGEPRHVRMFSTLWMCDNCCEECLVRLLFFLAEIDQIASLSLVMRDPYHRPVGGPKESEDLWCDCISSMRGVLSAAVLANPDLQPGLEKLHVWVMGASIEIISEPLMVAGSWLGADPRTAAMCSQDSAPVAAQQARAMLKLARKLLPPHTQF